MSLANGSPARRALRSHSATSRAAIAWVATPDRPTDAPCPQQRLVDAVDVGRVGPDRGVGHLGEVGELGPSARAFRVAEAHALQALFGGDFGEQEHGLGQRLLPAGKHLGVADRIGQREDDMGKRDVADAVGHGNSWNKSYDE